MYAPAHGFEHSSSDIQLGTDILVDSVEDTLVLRVVPPRSSHVVSPAAVLDKLHEMFGQANISTQSMHRAALLNLKQGPSEAVTPFTQRATALFDKLLLSGAEFTTASFLQCLQEAVLPAFSLMTVRLFAISSKRHQTVTAFIGQLLAEEARQLRELSLQGAVPGFPQTVAGVQDLGGAKHSNDRVGKAIVNPEGYRLAAAKSICWNCGEKGHRLSDCRLPLSKPFKFRPPGWASQRKLKQAPSAPPALPPHPAFPPPPPPGMQA